MCVGSCIRNAPVVHHWISRGKIFSRIERHTQQSNNTLEFIFFELCVLYRRKKSGIREIIFWSFVIMLTWSCYIYTQNVVRLIHKWTIFKWSAFVELIHLQII